MKLHKLPAHPSSDFSAQTSALFDKYVGRAAGSQMTFSKGRKHRQDQVRVMMVDEDVEVAKGGHGVPLTSESQSRLLFAS